MLTIQSVSLDYTSAWYLDINFMCIDGGNSVTYQDCQLSSSKEVWPKTFHEMVFFKIIKIFKLKLSKKSILLFFYNSRNLNPDLCSSVWPSWMILNSCLVARNLHFHCNCKIMFSVWQEYLKWLLVQHSSSGFCSHLRDQTVDSQDLLRIHTI